MPVAYLSPTLSPPSCTRAGAFPKRRCRRQSPAPARGGPDSPPWPGRPGAPGPAPSPRPSRAPARPPALRGALCATATRPAPEGRPGPPSAPVAGLGPRPSQQPTLVAGRGGVSRGRGGDESWALFLARSALSFLTVSVGGRLAALEPPPPASRQPHAPVFPPKNLKTTAWAALKSPPRCPAAAENGKLHTPFSGMAVLSPQSPSLLGPFRRRSITVLQT